MGGNRRRLFVKRWLPYGGTAVIVWLLLRQIRLQAVWQLLAGVDARWLLAGFAWYLLTNVLRSYRFAALMGIPGVLRPLRLLPDMIALSFLNNVLPARSGELSFPYLMRRRHGIPVGDGLAFLLVARVFDLTAVSSLFVMFALREQSRLIPAARPAVMGAGLLLLPVLLLLAGLPWLGDWGVRAGEWALGHLGLADRKGGRWLLGHGRRAVAAMARVHDPGLYGRVFLWSVLGWLTTFAWFAAFLQAIHTPASYSLVVVGAAFAALSKAIPFVTVGGFGAHEAGWTLGFQLGGMPLETAVASGFAVNILTLLASLAAGMAAFGIMRLSGPR